jgi:His-Xaa-Ser system protein HxsD
LKLQINKKIYDKEAILATAYSLSGDCQINFPKETEENIEISLEPKNENDITNFENKFLNELIDHQLRITLENRFGKIRELIVKHAFAPLDNLKAEVKNIVGRD